MTHQIYFRHKTLINTDPQRRCYNGHHFSSKVVWTAWKPLETIASDRVEIRLKFWRELNDYAVKERGQGTEQEFKVEELPP